MTPKTKPPKQEFRTLFLSDTHLYSEGCAYGLLNEFLKHKRFEMIYLVGDIVDFWQLNARKLRVYDDMGDPQDTDSHEEYEQKDGSEKSVNIIRRLLKRHQLDKTRIIYLPGNHDDFFRNFLGLEMFGLIIADEAIHHGADGREYLIFHGDRFDTLVFYHRWLALFSSAAYDWGIWLNRQVNRIRKLFGLKPWSLAKTIKIQVDNAILADFETETVQAARNKHVDGVICGHTHKPGIRQSDGITFANCGDWVEHRTAIVEHLDGRLELLTIDPTTRQTVSYAPGT